MTADSLAGVLGMLMFLVANVASSRDEEQTTEVEEANLLLPSHMQMFLTFKLVVVRCLSKRMCRVVGVLLDVN